MKIGDKVFVCGTVDEIRKDVVIIRNNGGYFGAIKSDIVCDGFAERKAGRWITHKIKLNGVYNSYCECTACGHTRPTTLFPLYYCPNCGAKMEGWNNE